MQIIKKDEKYIIIPVVIDEEVGEDRVKFIEMIRKLKVNKTYFFGASKVPWTHYVSALSREFNGYLNNHILFKKECLGDNWGVKNSNGILKNGESYCSCRYVFKFSLVKYKTRYGVLVKKTIETLSKPTSIFQLVDKKALR